jgi:hypothetical protein
MFLDFPAFRTCFQTSGVRKSRKHPINDFAFGRIRIGFGFLALHIKLFLGDGFL